LGGLRWRKRGARGPERAAPRCGGILSGAGRSSRTGGGSPTLRPGPGRLRWRRRSDALPSRALLSADAAMTSLLELKRTQTDRHEFWGPGGLQARRHLLGAFCTAGLSGVCGFGIILVYGWKCFTRFHEPLVPLNGRLIGRRNQAHLVRLYFFIAFMIHNRLFKQPPKK